MKITYSIIISLLISCSVFSQKTLSPEVLPFTKLAIVGSFDVEIVQGDKETLRMQSDDVDLSDVSVIQEDGFLKIKSAKDVFAKQRNVKVYLSFKQLSLIRLNAGAAVTASKSITFQDITFECNNGTNINMPITAEKVDVTVGQGATVSLEGTCKELEIQADNGGLFNAYELKSEKALAQANTGAIVKVWATNELEAKVIMGGQVSYRGQPKEFKKSKLFGGSVEMLVE